MSDRESKHLTQGNKSEISQRRWCKTVRAQQQRGDRTDDVRYPAADTKSLKVGVVGFFDDRRRYGNALERIEDLIRCVFGLVQRM